MIETNSPCLHPYKEADDRYCDACGQLLGEVTWKLWRGDTSLPLNDFKIPNDPFFIGADQELKLVAHNPTAFPITVCVELNQGSGITLDQTEEYSIAPYHEQPFFLRVGSDAVRGELVIKSQDGPRTRGTWWQPADWKEVSLSPLEAWLATAVEQWKIGVEDVIYLLPNIRKRSIRVWNRSFQKRELVCKVPAGFSVSRTGSPSDAVEQEVENSSGSSDKQAYCSVEANNSVEVHLTWERPTRAGATSIGDILIADKPLSIQRLEFPQEDTKAQWDAVVAIDFGTRNTRLRVLWGLTMAGDGRIYNTTVPVAHEKEKNSQYFPSVIIFNGQTGGVEQIGTEAEETLAADRSPKGSVAVTDLKTRLRNNQPPPPGFADHITLPLLLEKYFEYLLGCVEDYMRDAHAPVARQNMRILYVVCHPVLDDGEKREEYNSLLRTAMIKANISAHSQIEFVAEPVAALHHFFHEHPQIIKDWRDGERIAIVDSGGGTTDITIATFHSREGRLTLSDYESSALELASEKIHVALERFSPAADDAPLENQFGGDILDIYTAYAFSNEMLDQSNYLSYTDGDRPDEPLDLWSVQKEENSRRDVWKLSRARRMKEAIGSDRIVYLHDILGQNSEDEQYQKVYTSKSKYGELVVDPVLNDSVARTTKQGAAHVICVGGTSILELAREKFRALFYGAGTKGADDSLDKPVRLNAVADGAARYAADVVKQLPLRLLIDLDGAAETLSISQEIEHNAVPQRIPINIPNGDWNPKLLWDRSNTPEVMEGGTKQTNAPARSLSASTPARSAHEEYKPVSFTALSAEKNRIPAEPVALPNPPEPDRSHVILAHGYIDGARLTDSYATLCIKTSIAFGVECYVEVEVKTTAPSRRDLWTFPLF